MEAITLSSEQNRIIALTDNENCMLELKTDDVRKQSGLVRGEESLCYDIYGIKGRDKKIYKRTQNCITKVLPWAFTLFFTECKCSLKISIVKGCIFIYVEEAGLAESIILSLAPKYAEHFTLGRGFCASSQINCKPLENSLDRSLFCFTAQKMQGTQIYISFERDILEAEKNALFCLKNDIYGLKQKNYMAFCKRTNFIIEDEDQVSSARAWSQATGMSFITREDNYTGIWAGLPWFRDNWGRDTFIALPGILLVSGEFEIARNVIKGFLKFQDTNPKSRTYGRIPNRYNDHETIYNTADGAFYLIREIMEYVLYTGDVDFLKEVWPNIKLELETDLNFRTDSNGFLFHGDADTWMDARIKGKKAWSPRGNRANDIQVLFFTALLCASHIASLTGHSDEEKKWKAAAQKVKSSFIKYFWDGKSLADRIDTFGRADFSVRSNALMLLTIPLENEKFLPDEIAKKITEDTIKKLLFPWGLCSLSQDHVNFHPYHDNCKLYHKDAAYHNGTIWGWNDGFAIGAMCLTGHKELAWQLSKNLSDQILNLGCAGSMSENLSAYLDKENKIHPSGTFSQAWSVSEYNRVFWQYFLGLLPDFTKNYIYFKPNMPLSWKKGSARAGFGIDKNKCTLEIKWQDDKISLLLTDTKLSEIKIINRIGQLLVLKKDILLTKERSYFNSPDTEETLTFAMPQKTIGSGLEPHCLQEEDYLEKKILCDYGISEASYL